MSNDPIERHLQESPFAGTDMPTIDLRPGHEVEAAAAIRRLMIERQELIGALEAIAEALDVPRDRLRRLDGEHNSAESLRLLAVKYKTPGAQDRMDQSVHVARAVLARTKEQP